MSAELVKHTTPATSLPDMIRYAEQLANANLLPGQYRRQPANVLYAMEYGRTLGITPLAAINGIHVIEGKPSASAALISGLVRQAGHKLRVRVENGQGGPRAIATIHRSDDPDFEFRSEWDMARAQGAGLVNKDVWRKYPQAMLKARAITEVARDACEEVLFGLHYTPEELDANVSEDGVPVDAPVQQLRRVQPGEGDPWATPGPGAEPTISPEQSYADAAGTTTNQAAVKEMYRQANAAGLLAATVKVGEETQELGAYLIARGTELAAPKRMSDAEIAADTAKAREEMYDAAKAAGLSVEEASARFKAEHGTDAIWGKAEQLRAAAASFASADDGVVDAEVVETGGPAPYSYSDAVAAEPTVTTVDPVADAQAAERELRAAAAHVGLDNLDAEFEQSYGLPIAQAGAAQLRQMTAILTGHAA